jgi:NAD(P)-dependent dehydrogenase (short-subunit alcohol dehydrogenase family)
MNNIFDLTGKTALVTGASSGLGQSFAETLAHYGAKVAVAARRIDRLDDTVARIRKHGGTSIAIKMDVSDREDVRAGFSLAEDNLGSLDIVIANAGVGTRGTTLDMTSSDWKSVIDVNLNGVFYTAQEAAARMIKNGIHGSIITTASIMGLRVKSGAPAYASSKAAVIQLSKALALEFAEYGIRVNALAPGYFETELTEKFLHGEKGRAFIDSIPMKRTGRHEELDGALLLLASGAGSFMTGTVISVDGGHLVNPL